MSRSADDLLSTSKEALVAFAVAMAFSVVCISLNQQVLLLLVWLISLLLYSAFQRDLLASIVILHLAMAWLQTDAFFVKVLLFLLFAHRVLVFHKINLNTFLPVIPSAILLYFKMPGMWHVWILTLLSMGVSVPLIAQRGKYSAYALAGYSVIVASAYFFFPQLDILFLLLMLLLLFFIGKTHFRWLWMSCTLLLLAYYALSLCS